MVTVSNKAALDPPEPPLRGSPEPPLRVVIADDDPDSRELLRRILEGPATDIVEAVSGAELIQILAERGPFDLIVTDIDMPWMEGLQVLRAVRAAEILTPAVVVTGLARPGLEAAVARLGTTKLLRKPFGTSDLREVVGAILGVPGYSPSSLSSSLPSSLASRAARR